MMLQTAERPPAPPSNQETDPAPTLRVLILDDVKFDRIRLRRTINKVGLRAAVEEVATLEEMVACVNTNHFDIAFIDYHLTDGNGLMALERLKAIPKSNQPPAIMIAGEPSARIAEAALRMGYQDYLAKELLTEEALKAALYKALGDTKSANELERLFEVTNDIDPLPEEDRDTDYQAMVQRLIDRVRASRNEALNQSELPDEVAEQEFERTCQKLWSLATKWESVVTTRG